MKPDLPHVAEHVKSPERIELERVEQELRLAASKAELDRMKTSAAAEEERNKSVFRNVDGTTASGRRVRNVPR